MPLRSIRSYLAALFLSLTPVAPVAAAPRAERVDFRMGEFDVENGSALAVKLGEAVEKHRKNFHILLDSPGGRVDVGLALIDMVRMAREQGMTVTCTVDGMAASMAAVFLEACSVRRMTPQSAIMIHGVSTGGVEGNAPEIRRTVRRMDELNKRVAIFLSGRLCVPFETIYAWTRGGEDLWLGADEALKACAIDVVVPGRGA